MSKKLANIDISVKRVDLIDGLGRYVEKSGKYRHIGKTRVDLIDTLG